MNLADAIALAYQSNPTLQSQRAQLRGVDEGLVQARAALGPTASVQVSSTYQNTRLGYASPLEANSGQAQLTVSQSLYSGGRNALEIAAARDQIAASRQSLRATEGNLMLAVIQAYADVVRDTSALEVRAKNLKVLSDQVTETRVRVKDGELTLTDVAQAEAQLAAEHALYSTAQGQLQISRGQYATVVGANPDSLEPPPLLPGLPTTVDDAFTVAEADSPERLQALYSEETSHERVRAARSVYRPTVSAQIVAGYSGPATPFGVKHEERSVVGEIVISQPLFTSGLIGSQVRQALDQNTSDRIGIETTRRTEVQNVANAWNQILVSRTNVESEKEQIRAANIAYTGMRIEYRAGLRATLDVLIAEETLRDAELALLAARHDQYVAEATLLRVIGRLDAPDLVAGLPQYDVAENLRHIERQGAVPWMPVVQAIDALGAPGAGEHAIPAPAPAAVGAALAPPNPIRPDGALIETLPVVPVPGTVSGEPPPGR